MDDSNQHLKDLLSQTDLAFKALMRQPNSSELSHAYDNAKACLLYTSPSPRDRG